MRRQTQGIIESEGADPEMTRLFSVDGVRQDPVVTQETLQVLQTRGVTSVVSTERVIGRPHEEGIDYPMAAFARSACSGRTATGSAAKSSTSAGRYNGRMLLDRRRFLGGLPVFLPAAVAAADEPARTRFYVIEQYFMEQGSQPARIHDFFSKALLPAMERVHKGPKLFLESVLAPHMPQVVAIFGVQSCEQIWSISKALFADKDFTKAFDLWEAGETPYVSASATLLEATEFSPEIALPEKPPATPRVFEIRSYHSPTARQAKMLHERFAGPEIKIFHRSGVHPILYGSVVFGANRPNLTYVIPFETLAAREKAWAAFGGDEEWIRVRKESVDRGGQLTAVQNMSIFKAMPYSPIR